MTTTARDGVVPREAATAMDGGRYDSMDGGGRAAPGAAAESNAGRFGLLPSRGIRTSVCIRAIAGMPGAADRGGRVYGGAKAPIVIDAP
jgi:hypothetical protein